MYLDSAATASMVHKVELLHNFTPVSPTVVRLGDNSTIQAIGKGSLHLDTFYKDETAQICLSDVYLVPDLKKNLISPNQIVNRGYYSMQTSEGCVIRDESTNEFFLFAKPVHSLLEVQCRVIMPIDTLPSPLPSSVNSSTLHMESINLGRHQQLASSSKGTKQFPSTSPVDIGSKPHYKVSSQNDSSNDLPDLVDDSDDEDEVEETPKSRPLFQNLTPDLLHRRWGHPSIDRFRATVKSVYGMDVKVSQNSLKFCSSCVKGKQHRSKVGKGPAARAVEVLVKINSDLCGPMSTNSHSGKRYFLTFICDHSRYTFVYFLKTKDEVFNKFLELERHLLNQFGITIKVIHPDGGGEFMSKKFLEYLAFKGILHQPSAPYTPQHNGVAERLNRSIMEMALTILDFSTLPRTFWAEAVSFAVHLHNILPTKANDGISPFQMVHQLCPSLKGIRTFGSHAWTYIPKK